MTNTTTQEQAVEVLKQITAEHGHAPYFRTAEVIYNDGFYGVDLKVTGKEWREREGVRPRIPPTINRVPICVVVYG